MPGWVHTILHDYLTNNCITYYLCRVENNAAACSLSLAKQTQLHFTFELSSHAYTHKCFV